MYVYMILYMYMIREQPKRVTCVAIAQYSLPFRQQHDIVCCCLISELVNVVKPVFHIGEY